MVNIKYKIGDRVRCKEIHNPVHSLNMGDRNGHGAGWKMGMVFTITKIWNETGRNGPIYEGNGMPGGIYEDSLGLDTEWDE